ncbi:MAG: hypothetical protein IJ237_06410 [Oscillospiraceae bacterium]|nr:hypothetical protein [Oscillospiraceae bacterium]
MAILLIVIALVIFAALIIVMKRDDDQEPKEQWADEALTEEESILKEPSPIAEDDWMAEIFADPPEPAKGRHEKASELQKQTEAEKPQRKTENAESSIKPESDFDKTIVYDLDRLEKTKKATKPEKKVKSGTLESYPPESENLQEEPLIIFVLEVICGVIGVLTFFIVAFTWYVYNKRNGL